MSRWLVGTVFPMFTWVLWTRKGYEGLACREGLGRKAFRTTFGPRREKIIAFVERNMETENGYH